MHLWVTALVPCELKGAQHLKIQIVISYVFACNKNKALQLQRVPILSILGYNIGSTLLVLRQFCVGAGLYQILVRSFLR